MLLGKAEIRFLANLSTNLAAGYIGLIFVAPNFADLTDLNEILVLLSDLLFAILFSVISIKFEKRLL